MKRRFFVLSCVLVALCVAPTAGFAETLVRDCAGCVLGIFDDPELTRTSGNWPDALPVKRLWLGIKHDPGSELDGLTGIELSVDGLHLLPAGASVTFVVKRNPSVVLGSDIRTPPPLSGPEVEGGINAVWGECLSGDLDLVEITLFTLAPLTEPVELRVRRKFPAPDPEAQAPLFTDCDGPIFEKVIVSGGSYTLYPPVAVEAQTWGRIKTLYR